MELSASTFTVLREYIHRACGLALSSDKHYLVQQRLEPLVQASGCSGFEEFARRLPVLHSPSLQLQVIEAITTNETSFFRDSHPFDTFRRHLLPEISRRVRDRQRSGYGGRGRIWSAGCSTGQEPYSLALTIVDFCATSEALGLTPADFQVLATDVSPRVLAEASAGIYEQRDLERGLSPDQVLRHFQPVPGGWEVRPALRRLVEFRRLNLVQPFPALGSFDLIFCRNTLIYFDVPTRQRICEQFAELLVPGGCLLLGTAENLYGITEELTSEKLGETIVYRKG